MKLTKILKDGIGGGPMSPVNELRIEGLYASKAQVLEEKSQAILGLQNLLKTYGRLWKNVDSLDPIESIRANSISYADRVAGQIVFHSIDFTTVESEFKALIASGKVVMDERKLSLALEFLASAVNQRKSGAAYSSLYEG